MGVIRWIGAALIGEAEALPQQLLARYPELERVKLAGSLWSYSSWEGMV